MYHFPKRLHLLKPADFRRVLDAHNFASDRFLRLGGIANGLAHPRLGLTVSRKVGPAVARNRWKRVLREAFRLSQHELPALDLVCVPRGDSCPPLAQLVATLRNLARRIEQQVHRENSSRQGEVLPPLESLP